MKTRLICAMLALPTLASAQPYSESMADCASFYQNGAQMVRSDARAESLMVSVRAWHAAAVVQAGREGRNIGADAMWDKIDAKTDDWEAKGLGFAFTEEFRDWAKYCRSFGNAQGIALPQR